MQAGPVHVPTFQSPPFAGALSLAPLALSALYHALTI